MDSVQDVESMYQENLSRKYDLVYGITWELEDTFERKRVLSERIESTERSMDYITWMKEDVKKEFMAWSHMVHYLDSYYNRLLCECKILLDELEDEEYCETLHVRKLQLEVAELEGGIEGLERAFEY